MKKFLTVLGTVTACIVGIISAIINFIFIMLIILGILVIYAYSPKENPEQDMVAYSNRDGEYFEYQEKVLVFWDPAINGNSSLLLKTEKDGTFQKEVLSGRFENFCWHDDMLFIIMDNKYYEFDIDSYEIPPLDEYGKPEEPEYELKEYSESEFIKTYPDYETFDW